MTNINRKTIKRFLLRSKNALEESVHLIKSCWMAELILGSENLVNDYLIS